MNDTQIERQRVISLLNNMAENMRWGIDQAKDAADRNAAVMGELQLRRAVEGIRCGRHLPPEECLAAEPKT